MQNEENAHGKQLTNHTLEVTDGSAFVSANASHILRSRLIDEPVTYHAEELTMRSQLYLDFRHAISMFTNPHKGDA